jgi:hypothetical protein
LGGFVAPANCKLGNSRSQNCQFGKEGGASLVDTVLVDIDEVVPGYVDEETGAITIDDTADAVNYGVVDEIARVWLNSGRVLAVRRDDIPGQGSLAAILRYAP